MLPSTLNMEARVMGDDPDTQVADTIELMAQYVREDAHSPEVTAVASEIAPPGAPVTEILDGTFDYVKRLIRFQADETTAAPLASHLVQLGFGDLPVVEVLIRPRDMLTWQRDTGRRQVGDCDDFTMLTAALLMNRGIRTNFVTAAADFRQPGQWSHVYVAAYLKDGSRVPLDTSHGEYPGWEVESVSRRREWEIEGSHRGLIIAAVLALVLWAQWAGARWKRRNA